MLRPIVIAQMYSAWALGSMATTGSPAGACAATERPKLNISSSLPYHFAHNAVSIEACA